MIDWDLVEFLGGVAVIVMFLVLGYLVSNKKLKPPFLKPAQFVWYGVSLGLVILLLVWLLIGGAIDFYQWTDTAGWIPRTEVVKVYAHASEWMDGEYKTCFSTETHPAQEITYLDCSAFDKERQGVAFNILDEAHDLSVRFWGQNDTERYRTWSCERTQFLGMASFTCKLQ